MEHVEQPQDFADPTNARRAASAARSDQGMFALAVGKKHRGGQSAAANRPTVRFAADCSAEPPDQFLTSKRLPQPGPTSAIALRSGRSYRRLDRVQP